MLATITLFFASLFSLIPAARTPAPCVAPRACKNRGALFAFALTAFFLIGIGAAAPAYADDPLLGNTNLFDNDGNSGTKWIQMLRGNYKGDWKCFIPFFCNDSGTAPVADPGASYGYAKALRLALGVYSNAILVVASVILLYHLLIMTGETAKDGVAGGKRANQIWAPIRLVIAIGLLVPLSKDVGLNSGQYITLQIIEWGSNMASRVWHTFVAYAGEGTGTNPTPHMPDTSAISREAAKIGACMALLNSQSPDADHQIQPRSYGPAIVWGDAKNESLCGSVIIFAGGLGAAAGLAGIQQVIDQTMPYYKYFLEGNAEFNTDPGPAPLMALAFALGTLESVSGGWNNGAPAGTGWVSAGAYFLTLAAGGSNRVSGTDTLPIIMGPQAEKIRPEKIQNAFYRMANWIVGRYKPHISGGGADTDMLGNTVAGRKFVDLMLLLVDQMGVVSGLWSPGNAAFVIDLNNSPLAELVDLGHRMIRTALDFVGAAVELGVNEPQHAQYAALADSTPESKAFGPKSGQFFATMAIPILSSGASALLSMGILIGIFTPLLPFVKFVLSVLTWLISVMETMVCMPLLALAYLTPYGEGFGGQKVEPGYYLIMHAFLRPVMTIFGLVASILLFNISAHLVTTFYLSITQNAGSFQGGMYVVAKISFGMMYCSILYLCLNSALKVMETFGRHATRWLGGQSHEEFLGDGQAAVQQAQQGTAMLTQGLSQMAGYSLNAGAQLAGTPSPGAGNADRTDPRNLGRQNAKPAAGQNQDAAAPTQPKQGKAVATADQATAVQFAGNVQDATNIG